MLLNLSNTEIILLVYAIFIIFCIIIVYVKEYIFINRIKNVDVEIFLPQDEMHYLKQIFYLGMSGLFLIGFLGLFLVPSTDFSILVIDFIIAIVAIVYIADKRPWRFILSLLLIPSGSVLSIMDISLPFLMYIIHFIGIFITVAFFIKKFWSYTKNNNLGLTAILFIGILAVSFSVTLYSEHTTFLDSLVMVSNAFTSNGYSVLGKTSGGKFTSILLVWGGYLLSGVGTATLCAAIINNSFRKKLKKQENEVAFLKEKIVSADEKNDILLNEIKELKNLIKNKE